jgi:hypothetical protein
VRGTGAGIGDEVLVTTDPLNPKDAAGQAKPSISDTPLGPLFEISRVLSHGAVKYGRFNWRDTSIRASVYFNAIFRHLSAWFDGQDIDPDSGEHHLAHVGANVFVCLDAIARGKFIDDRGCPPVRNSLGSEMEAMLAAVRDQAARGEVSPLLRGLPMKPIYDGSSAHRCEPKTPLPEPTWRPLSEQPIEARNLPPPKTPLDDLPDIERYRGQPVGQLSDDMLDEAWAHCLHHTATLTGDPRWLKWRDKLTDERRLRRCLGPRGSAHALMKESDPGEDGS